MRQLQANVMGHHVPEPVKDFGAGLTSWPPDDVTRSTASPRWLVPSERKRKMPSTPAKPDGLVSTSSVKWCGPFAFTSPTTSETASYERVAVRTGSCPKRAR